MPGWKLRTTPALASKSPTESWAAARPPRSRARKVATSLTALSARASSTARRSPDTPAASAQAVTSGRDSTDSPRSARETADWLSPAARASWRPDSPASMRTRRNSAPSWARWVRGSSGSPLVTSRRPSAGPGTHPMLTVTAEFPACRPVVPPASGGPTPAMRRGLSTRPRYLRPGRQSGQSARQPADQHRPPVHLRCICRVPRVDLHRRRFLSAGFVLAEVCIRDSAKQIARSPPRRPRIGRPATGTKCPASCCYRAVSPAPKDWQKSLRPHRAAVGRWSIGDSHLSRRAAARCWWSRQDGGERRNQARSR